MAPQAKMVDTQAQATRAEILHHAHDLFAHYGYWKTNIGDIAERSGMSPGNLYRYYRNKQAIGLASVAQYFQQVEAAMLATLADRSDPAEARIRAALRTCVEHLVVEFERNPKLVELAEFLCGDDEGLKILDAHVAVKRQTIAAEIRLGIQDGSLKACDPETTAATILMALKAFWTPMTLVLWRDQSTVLPDLEAILDLMFDGLRT